ncbi:secondary thiamine-phosphate synthase enzyme [Halomicrobium zhouii]|uniref:Secondary thiamine-phosphate synthase enzyme n=1 Tax=Halomicrobium zhouii TaxID=767519 RepID=A0A1I6LXK0_9EURY|nr:secondary thiamine-phosphate synthase enzyme YjbQ [Halomicrobium zhouii]SFS08022.1 secondary thiamine-phosphate synthase enzyme [Halomicrobium zhouii]
MTTFTVDTDQRLSVVDVTDQVRQALPPDAHGTATVFVRHTTAAVTVNEAEPRLLGDFEDGLAELVADEGWAHDQLDGNADSHLRAALIGPDAAVPVSDGDLDLGTWQSVLLVECDGPRSRTVDVRA